MTISHYHQQKEKQGAQVLQIFGFAFAFAVTLICMLEFFDCLTR